MRSSDHVRLCYWSSYDGHLLVVATDVVVKYFHVVVVDVDVTVVDTRTLHCIYMYAEWRCSVNDVLFISSSTANTEDRDKWRKYVHGVANPRIEDG